MDTNFGQRLKRLRTAQALNIKESARRIGVAESTYREWENGRSILGEPYMRIAETFKVSLSELISGQRVEKLNEVELLERELQSLLSKIQFLKSRL